VQSFVEYQRIMQKVWTASDKVNAVDRVDKGEMLQNAHTMMNRNKQN